MIQRGAWVTVRGALEFGTLQGPVPPIEVLPKGASPGIGGRLIRPAALCPHVQDGKQTIYAASPKEEKIQLEAGKSETLQL